MFFAYENDNRFLILLFINAVVFREKPGGCRRGYMGHLIKITNSVSIQAEKGPFADFLQQVIPEEVLNSWKTFIIDAIEPINNIHQTCLVSLHIT